MASANRDAALSRNEGIGCVPMQNLLLLAKLQALGVCPCKVYYFGRTGGKGRLSMQSLLLLVELKALGVCPCRFYYFWQN